MIDPRSHPTHFLLAAAIFNAIAFIVLCFGLIFTFHGLYESEGGIIATQRNLLAIEANICSLAKLRATTDYDYNKDLYNIEIAQFKRDSLQVHKARASIYLDRANASFELSKTCSGLPVK